MATIVRFREPFRGMTAVNDEFERLARAFFEAPRNGAPTSQAWAPPLDVWETENEIVYAFDLPGIPESDISVELEDGSVTVSAKRERTHEVETDRFFRYERRFGEFARTLAVPDGVVEKDVKAHYDNGVLEVHVHKPEQPKPARIPVAKTLEGKKA